MAVQRIFSRVKKGGRHIPENVIHRRYEQGIRNLFEIYIDICDKVCILDNTNKKIQLIVQQKSEMELEILKPKKINAMKTKFTVLKEPNVPYFDEFTQKIMDAMEVHYKKLIEQTIKENSYLIVCDDNGNIIRETAEDLKRQFPQYA